MDLQMSRAITCYASSQTDILDAMLLSTVQRVNDNKNLNL